MRVESTSFENSGLISVLHSEECGSLCIGWHRTSNRSIY